MRFCWLIPRRCPSERRRFLERLGEEEDNTYEIKCVSFRFFGGYLFRCDSLFEFVLGGCLVFFVFVLFKIGYCLGVLFFFSGGCLAVVSF